MKKSNNAPAVTAVVDAALPASPSSSLAKRPKPASLIKFYPYQQPIFLDRSTGLQMMHWSRQIGKSFTLAAWGVDRLLSRPGRLVTILSNSRDNGQELNLKCAEVCNLLQTAYEQEDLSPDTKEENLSMETRIKARGKWGRIKVLAANPRTARGFSGDLFLDEFAFHEHSNAIYEAAEPILSSHPDYLCRIASTGNGRHNMFYQMVTSGLFPVSRVSRTEAWKQGRKIYHPVTREEITPEEARKLALDKAAYDQNYELGFGSEMGVLLTLELISQAEREDVGAICEFDWTPDVIDRLRAAIGPLYVGVDVGRKRDLTVITVMEKLGYMYFVRAILRLDNMRLPDQQARLRPICALPKFQGAMVDMTGLGTGLTEYAQDEFGRSRITGINFANTVPITDKLKLEGRTQETVRITEAMATDLLEVYEDHAIQHPYDMQLRNDLRKPERIVSPGGRVSIAAVRDEADHADHFWSFALAVRAGSSSQPFAYRSVSIPSDYTRFRPLLGAKPRGILV